jgi:hypothetical protein
MIYLLSYFDSINAKLIFGKNYNPRDCFPMSSQIQCIGDNVNVDVLKKIYENFKNDTNETQEVNLILIQNTSISEISVLLQILNLGRFSSRRMKS